MTEKLLTTQGAARFLNISEQELENLAASGKIPSYRIGGKFLRFKEQDILRFKTNEKALPTPPLRARAGLIEKIADFLYFNDFYIISIIIILIMLLFIFR